MWDSICPWCNKKIDNLDEYELSDGEENHGYCDECDRPIKITRSIISLYDIKKAAREEGKEETT